MGKVLNVCCCSSCASPWPSNTTRVKPSLLGRASLVQAMLCIAGCLLILGLLAQAASSSKPQQTGAQEPPPGAHPTPAGSKNSGPKGKVEPAKPEADSQPAARRLRVRGLTHTDTKLKKSEGQGELANCSHKVVAHTPSVEPSQQRRSSRQPLSGSAQKGDPHPAGGVQTKPHPKQGVQPLLTAGKSNSKGKRPAETNLDQKAEGSKQVVGALSKGKKAVGSKWEPAELEVPLSLSAKRQKAASSKGKLKGPSPHSVTIGKVKGAAGVKKQAKAQPHAQEWKPVPDTEEEPGVSSLHCDTTAQDEQLGTDALDSSFGLGKGKRKRTATKPLHLEEEEHSKAEDPGGSKHHSLAGKLEEAPPPRCAH